MGEGVPDRDASYRVPCVLLIALAAVVTAMVALPLVAQPPPSGVHAMRALTSRDAAGMPGSSGRSAPIQPRQGAPAVSGPDDVPIWPAVVAAARSQVGARYAAQGDTPRTGFSCVGLVLWAYAQAGVAVPESEAEMAADFPAVAGAAPDGSGLLPGDILLYRDTAWAGLSHASIYVGDRLMVSADSPEAGVRLDRIDDAYWVAHWAGAVRVPPPPARVRAPLHAR